MNEGRWNWRHDSILINIARMLAKIQGVIVYCDVDGTEFQTPSVITGEIKRPDIVVMKGKECRILELTVGFETNMVKNSDRKKKHYADLVARLEKDYEVKYFDLSMGGIGAIGKDSKKVTDMFEQLGLSKEDCNYLVRKMINVCIRTTYYIFCQRNKEWESPSLLTW